MRRRVAGWGREALRAEARKAGAGLAGRGSLGEPTALMPATSSNLEERVRAEIEALHEFFVGWFTGRLPEDAFDAGFSSRFDREFLLVPPAGTTLSIAELGDGVRAGRATNPDFRIAIRNVRVRRVLERHVLATYEEWQRYAIASTPPDNARVASVWFADGDPLRWLHVHETWLPEPVATAGPYDF